MKKLILLCAAIGTVIAFANNLDSTNSVNRAMRV